MLTATTTTFQQTIDRHKGLIAAILSEEGLDESDLIDITPEQFVEYVGDATHVLAQSPLWSSDHETMEAAHAQLADALQLADSDPAKAVLLDTASRRLDSIDATDFNS